MQETYDVGAAVAKALKSVDTARAPEEMTIEMSGGAADLLQSLTKQLDRDRGSVISEALSLLFVGVTAQKEGMQVAIIDQGGKAQTVLDLLAKD